MKMYWTDKQYAHIGVGCLNLMCGSVLARYAKRSRLSWYSALPPVVIHLLDHIEVVPGMAQSYYYSHDSLSLMGRTGHHCIHMSDKYMNTLRVDG